MSTLCFYAQFTFNKIGVNSLTVTWDIDQVTRSDGTRSALVTGDATNVVIGRRGLYGFLLPNADLTLYDYIATAITPTTTVDLQEIPALWTLWSTPNVLGSGSIIVTINITELGVPQDGVEVWVTTDLAGTNVVASGVTDVFGNLVVALDSGNYYVWKQKAGINFTNPQVMVV